MDKCRQLLLRTKVSSLKHSQALIVLRDVATVEQALQTLAEHKVLSAPVVSTSDIAHGDAHLTAKLHSGEEVDEVLGFVDVRDILSSFLQGIPLEKLVKMNLLERMHSLEESGPVFAQTQLKDLKVMGSDGDFLHATQAKASLLELIAYGFLNPQRRGMHNGEGMSHVVHRVAMFDSKGQITQIISQTDIVRFLLQHKQELGELGSSTAQQLGWADRRVESCSPYTSALEAMSVMEQKGVSSLAIVDKNGAIMGNFSISELRSIMAHHFGALALPVGEFVALEHGIEYVGYNRVHEEGVVGSAGHRFVQERLKRMRASALGDEVGQCLVLAAPDSSLLDIMQQLVHHGVHRVYVVDEQRRPVGIVTHTDILRKVTEAAGS